MAQLKLVVVTPEATALEQDATFVVVPLYDGELGIAPAHAPMIGRLGYGELRFRLDGQSSHYYVDGGFVQVNENEVTILTARLIPAEKLDAQAAQQQLQEAVSRPAPTDELLEQRERLVAQARAKMLVARKA